MVNSKIYLAVLVAALLGVMQCAAGDLILFDRSGGGMGLQKMLGLVLQSKGVEWPDDLTVSVKNIAALPEDFPGVVATESFLPVDKNKFVQLDYAVLPVIA